MDTFTAGSRLHDKGFGPIQMLGGKRKVEKDSLACNDETAMTHAGVLYTEALAAAHNAPDVRQDRIEAIRAQIESGAYEIDLKKLAENLIRENPDLFDE